ncbi:hypothetical protein FA13DRAFT_1730943 [Coprinellus micaceus]|uniref:RED-like N-terminal domain-containing protein n=1 Tax=Coprinellus micaceus TaxID=71717 RepID=A0A4Y7THZ0_COPMI|nr:hypothetical protein FA13DRAFT_1730943 [Coprinellus micaceus]
MDQSEFRRMLQSEAGSSSASAKKASTSRGSLLATAAKPKKIDSSEPAFKPRKVKTKDSKYRDRASERRHGEGNDYAHVEALLEDFEKQTKEAKSQAEIEEKRKYLGGDSEHSVLVKGLDFALLEQNKAKAALVNDAFDEDSLEKAFQEAASSEKPKKRSKQELLQELKKKRAGGGDVEGEEGGEEGRSKSAGAEAKRLDELKQRGKFKPIGFKPIGQQEGVKKKKKAKEGVDGERKKKKRKVDANSGDATNPKASENGSQISATPARPSAPPEPELVDNDLDIFADAGEYEGLGVGDDDDDEEDTAREVRKPVTMEDEEEGEFVPRQWISVEDDAEPPRHSPSHPRVGSDVEMDEEGEERPMKLKPLASSAFDIKELLEMDRAATSSRKNKKRKDKKAENDTGPAQGDDEAAKSKAAADRAERDYKRLKAYTDKKGSAK